MTIHFKILSTTLMNNYSYLSSNLNWPSGRLVQKNLSWRCVTLRAALVGMGSWKDISAHWMHSLKSGGCEPTHSSWVVFHDLPLYIRTPTLHSLSVICRPVHVCSTHTRAHSLMNCIVRLSSVIKQKRRLTKADTIKSCV